MCVCVSLVGPIGTLDSLSASLCVCVWLCVCVCVSRLTTLASGHIYELDAQKFRVGSR